MSVATEPADARETSRRARLAELLAPASSIRVGPAEGFAVLFLCSVAAFLRLGSSAWQGRLWAEDGTVFMQQAIVHGPVSPFGYRYGGYLSTSGRLIAAVLWPLPLSWQGVAMDVAATLTEGALALIVYVALRGHLPGRGPRALVAACMVMVPVGPEAIGNVANLQWFLVFAAVVCLLWTPATTIGWVAMAAVTFLAVTSSPFGAFVFASALVRVALHRTRALVIVFGTTALGFLIQTAAMLTAPPRTGRVAVHPALHPAQLLEGWLRRVVGDGALGVGRLSQTVHTSIVSGVIVTLVCIGIAVTTRAARGAPHLTFVAVAVGFSLATFAAPIVLSGAPTDDPYFSARYFVTSALFAETTFIALAARAGAMLRVRIGAASVCAAGLAAVAIAALGFGLVTSYDVSHVYGRDRGPTWADSARYLERRCEARPASTRVRAEIFPIGHGWFVRLDCRVVRKHS